MRVVSLASGSKGNAYWVGTRNGALLVDCGLTHCELVRRFDSAGLDIGSVGAVVITHSHTDHTQGLRVFLRHHDVPVYANCLTAETISHECGVPAEAFVCFENGQTFDVGGFTVEPFPIPHDTADPVGYLIRAEGLAYFHGTDIGTPLDSIGRHLSEADLATLESNHDPVLLATSGRPAMLKQRISGPRGHLSNNEAAGLVKKFASPRLRRLALAHLSGECNAPHLAEMAMRDALSEMKREDVTLRILRQDGEVEL